jgi:hypothetical protein
VGLWRSKAQRPAHICERLPHIDASTV